MPRRLQAFPALLALLAAAGAAHAAESTTLLKTTRSWDGTPYPAYPAGQPQVTVLRIVIPPHSTLAWHHHPVINAAYVLEGALTVEKRAQAECNTLSRTSRATVRSVRKIDLPPTNLKARTSSALARPCSES